MSSGAKPAQKPGNEPTERWSRVRHLMKQAGIDALLVADNDDFTRVEGGNVRFLSNVVLAFPFGAPIIPIVVLPLDGEPALVIPSCGWDCLPAVVGQMSWIDRIESAPPIPLLEKVKAMTGGGSPTRTTAELIAKVLKSHGLEGARIGLSGQFPALAETRELLPQARIEAVTVLDDAGRPHDLVEFERARTKTAYEVSCMERAHSCMDAGVRAFERSVIAGNTYANAQTELDYAMKMAGADETFYGGSRGRGPVGTYAPLAWGQGTFQAGDMIAFELNARVGGYWAQLARTWVVGRPTAAQVVQLDATRRAFEAMEEKLQVGVTGAEIFEAGRSVLQAAGFEPLARFGHAIGISMQEWFSVLVGDRGRIQEGQAVVIHTAAINPRTGEESLYGGQYIMRDGKARPLQGRTADFVLPLAS